MSDTNIEISESSSDTPENRFKNVIDKIVPKGEEGASLKLNDGRTVFLARPNQYGDMYSASFSREVANDGRSTELITSFYLYPDGKIEKDITEEIKNAFSAEVSYARPESIKQDYRKERRILMDAGHTELEAQRILKSNSHSARSHMRNPKPEIKKAEDLKVELANVVDDIQKAVLLKPNLKAAT